jgi:hypothetical protein
VCGVVGTRASRRHGSRVAAHDQVRSACSRAVPTNVFQARNISYMPSILNLAISVYYIRTALALLRLIRVTWCTRPSWEGRSRNKCKSFSLRLVPFAFPSAGSPIMPAHTAPCTRPHIVSVDSTPISASRVWRSV